MTEAGDAQSGWRVARGRVLALRGPTLMGIINTTPDSFSDGGERLDPGRAADAALRMVEDGADAIDVGAESTRPGAARVSEEEQIARAIPAIRAMRARGLVVPISIDTTRAAVARAAIGAGADAINDVSGGTDDATVLSVAAAHGAGLILMHRLALPEADRYSDRYGERTPDYAGGVVGAVVAALRERLESAIAAGVGSESIVLDPGLGFGKTVEQNAELVRGTASLLGLGRPILGAASRKSFVGRIGLGRDSSPDERLVASVAFSIAQAARGVRLFRVHDVRAHAEAFRVWASVGSVEGRVGESVRHGS